MLLDTESTQLHEVIFHEQTAYWWERDGLCYFVYQKNGYELNVIGHINYKEAVKIAESMQI